MTRRSDAPSSNLKNSESRVNFHQLEWNGVRWNLKVLGEGEVGQPHLSITVETADDDGRGPLCSLDADARIEY